MSQEEALLAGYKMPETTQKQPQEGERTFQKRSPAIKVSINEILTGKFVRKEGLNLNYVETAYGEQISRANLISSVLVKDAVEAKILKNAIRTVHKNLHQPKYQSKTKSMRANDKGEYRVWRVS